MAAKRTPSGTSSGAATVTLATPAASALARDSSRARWFTSTAQIRALGEALASAIAIALAKASPRARIWAVDVNQRALELSRANAEAAGVANVTVAAPDDVPDGVRFAAIYSNPPVRIGKAAMHEILDRWLDRLAPGGAAYLVVQRNLGSDSLAAWLAASGRDVDRLKSKKGYRILRVRAA